MGTSPSQINVLVSEAAYEEFEAVVERAASEQVSFVRASADGLRDDDGAVDPATTPIQVAWLSGDIFASGSQAGKWFAPHFVGSSDLEWLHSSTAGLDLPVFGVLCQRGVRVTAAHIYGIPIAEYVIRCALEHFQRPGRWRDAQTAHEWAPGEMREVAGSTWLVVGVGDIGGTVADRARAFGAQVIGVARGDSGRDRVDELVRPADVLHRLAAADVVVLARPGEPSEKPLVDDEFLEQMKDGSLFVNISRGSLVDEDALLRALERRRPARAALDVTAEEPLPQDHPFWDHPAVDLTPHASGQGGGRFGRGADVFADHLRRYLAGELFDDDGAAS